MGARRSSVTAVVAVTAVVLLVSLLVTWASSIGPDRVLAGDGPATHRVSPTPTATSSAASGAFRPLRELARPPRHADHPVADSLVSLLLVVLLVGLCAGLVIAGKRAWERWQLRRRPPPTPAEVEFDPIRTPRRVAEEILRGADAQRALLERGSPRNAIVACWRRFEEQAAEAGVLRRPWETSAEFTLRVLDLVDAEASAVMTLAALFREARFSDHPLGEPQRAEAIAALDTVHAGLGALRTGQR